MPFISLAYSINFITFLQGEEAPGLMQRRDCAQYFSQFAKHVLLSDSRAYSSVLQAVVMAHLTRPPGLAKRRQLAHGGVVVQRHHAHLRIVTRHLPTSCTISSEVALIRHSCRQCLLYPDPDTLPRFGRARVPLHVSRAVRHANFRTGPLFHCLLSNRIVSGRRYTAIHPVAPR